MQPCYNELNVFIAAESAGTRISSTRTIDGDHRIGLSWPRELLNAWFRETEITATHDTIR